MTQTREKRNSFVLSRADFEWYEGAIVFCAFIFIIFCLEPTIRKNNWMRITIVNIIMVIVSKVLF